MLRLDRYSGQMVLNSENRKLTSVEMATRVSIDGAFANRALNPRL